ncbi:MAG: hypothetical protein ACTSW1_04325 [Candidatus Hodarchaeales archaeon]
MSNPLPKLLKNPLTIKILQTLADQDCYINELADVLNVKDFRRILAVINELVSVGLVVYVDKNDDNQVNYIDHVNLYKSDILISNQPVRPLSSAFGIPLNEYIELWNILNKDFEKKDLGSLGNIQFKIPPPLRTRIKGKSAEELIEMFSIQRIL